MKRINLVNNGFKRLQERDFEDDGNHFKGYEYKGLPITYLNDSTGYYLCLRLDYLGVPYNQYREDYRILDEFNGVDKIDMDKLIANCEYIINKYNIKVNA